MPEEKVYTPEIQEDAPFPEQDEQSFSEVRPSAGGNYSPTTTKDVPIRRKRIAHELIGTALNTQSRRILGEFTLEQSGGFKMGNYQDGEAGDLRITPSGLTARNKAGVNTFAIDGETGEATFLGTVQAGTVIAAEIDGDLITAGTISADKLSADYIEVGGADADIQDTGINDEVELGSANIVLDGANNRIVINDGTNDRVLIGYQSGGF